MTRTAAEDAEFTRSTEPFRRELLAHCYRLLGSVDEAEDLVQETYLRAWRGYAGFEGRSSLRTWLYTIASHACLTALGHQARRPLPSGLGAPAEDVTAPATVPADGRGGPVRWLQPIPDALVTGAPGDPGADPGAGLGADPATVAVSRESLRLALVASFQYLPPRQRAVLLLRDVLAFPAADVATMLGLTVPAVKSLLQRARARLQQASPAADQITEPTAAEARRLLDAYIAAFEASDPAALAGLLRRDATLELPPSATWFRGDHAIAGAVAGLFSPGDWRMTPTQANGQPAAAVWLRAPDGRHHPYGIAVLMVSASGIAGIVAFADPSLVALFGFPDEPPARHPA
ncbi:MAG TPA: sigma-70 family RNA polymerase sigma factor [Streptosporangiaceae bacterium]|jgi:RNA polymerase sigma-70 factor (ECF subfamily)